MRRLVLILGVLSLPLAGCAGSIPAPSTIVAVAEEPLGDFTVLDEKAWYYSESLYNVPATAYLAANDRGLFEDVPELKAWLKSTLQYMNKLRVQIRDAYHDGNVAGFNEKLKILKKYSDMIKPMIPGSSASLDSPALSSNALAIRVAQS